MQDYTCTFISQDGGETWRDIDFRAMVFEFGDAVRSFAVAVLSRACHAGDSTTVSLVCGPNISLCSQHLPPCSMHLEASAQREVLKMTRCACGREAS